MCTVSASSVFAMVDVFASLCAFNLLAQNSIFGVQLLIVLRHMLDKCSRIGVFQLT